MRINEDYIDNVKPDELADDYSSLSMDVRQNVEWLLAGQYTNIDFDIIGRPVYKPKDSKELKELIRMCIIRYGYECDLNWIDVSEITDMEELFVCSKFNGDISGWDVSKVVKMNSMFEMSLFNGNISCWDVSRVTDMTSMFSYAPFNSDISRWNVSSVMHMQSMFYQS